MRSLILDYQISITALGSCSPLHSKVFPQLNKWARELNWMSRRSIYKAHFKTYLLGSNSAHCGVTRRACRSDRTCPVSSQWLHCIGHSPPDMSGQRKMSLDPFWTRPNSHAPASGHVTFSIRSLPKLLRLTCNSNIIESDPIPEPMSSRRSSHCCAWCYWPDPMPQRFVLAPSASGQSFKLQNTSNLKNYVNEVDFYWSLGWPWAT
jgi:hypothetical protein